MKAMPRFPCEHVVAKFIRMTRILMTILKISAKYYKHSNAFPMYPIPNFGKPDIDGVEEIGVEPPLTKNILGGQSLRG
ncbi:unnamed protein product [Malus baccata var. baccata]